MTPSIARPLFALFVGLLAAGLLFVPATAMAQAGQGQGGGQGHFTSPRHLLRVADDLDLTEEQREQIGDILEDNHGDIYPLRQEMRQEGESLQEMMGDANVERQEVYDQLDKVLELEAQVKRKRTSMMLDVRAVLNEEQLEMAQELFEERGGQMREQRREHRQQRQENRKQRRQQNRQRDGDERRGL